MSNTLLFYSDAGLTVPLSRLEAAQSTTGTAGAVDQVVWLGSPVAGHAFQASSDPGTDPVIVSIIAVSYTHLRAHETVLDLVCRLLLEKKKKSKTNKCNTH